MQKNERSLRTAQQRFLTVWVTAVNGFFFVLASFSVWEDYAGIGKLQTGIRHVDVLSIVFPAILMFGITSEAFRLRIAVYVNVGVYAATALLLGVGAISSAYRSPQHNSLALVAVVIVLFVSIAVANLLLYLGISPFPSP